MHAPVYFNFQFNDCEECNKKFVSRARLDIHRKKYHGGGGLGQQCKGRYTYDVRKIFGFFDPASPFRIKFFKIYVQGVPSELRPLICVPSSCPAAQPLLPNSHQPRQNRADNGPLKIQVIATQSTSRWDTHPVVNFG